MNHRGTIGASIFAWRFPRRIRLWLGHVPRCGSARRPSHRRPRTVMRGHCQEHGDVNRHFTDTGKGVWPFARQWRAANPPDLVSWPPILVARGVHQGVRWLRTLHVGSPTAEPWPRRAKIDQGCPPGLATIRALMGSAASLYWP